MRVRVHFAKTEAMKFTGHLDLFRTWERTIRRAGLPLAYSQGFRPHPRLNLAAALPLGFTSDCELIDIWLEQELELHEIKSALIRAVPPGITVFSVEPVDPRAPALQSIVETSEYLIIIQPMPELSQRIDSILSSDSLVRRWRDKEYDLRALIRTLEYTGDDDDGRQRIIAQLSAQEGATGRPEEVILALGGEPTTSQVHRTRLAFRQELVSESTTP
jgi:radical SAM-linked protein